MSRMRTKDDKKLREQAIKMVAREEKRERRQRDKERDKRRAQFPSFPDGAKDPTYNVESPPAGVTVRPKRPSKMRWFTQDGPEPGAVGVTSPPPEYDARIPPQKQVQCTGGHLSVEEAWGKSAYVGATIVISKREYGSLTALAQEHEAMVKRLDAALRKGGRKSLERVREILRSVKDSK